MFCPNLSNPEVKREFEELVSVVGEAIAYDIWDQNNGNGIDKASNGKPSILFNSLLEEFNGDRSATILAKAKVFSKSFKTAFKGVVDANNEPLVSELLDSGDIGLGETVLPSDTRTDFERKEAVASLLLNRLHMTDRLFRPRSTKNHRRVINNYHSNLVDMFWKTTGIMVNGNTVNEVLDNIDFILNNTAVTEWRNKLISQNKKNAYAEYETTLGKYYLVKEFRNLARSIGIDAALRQYPGEQEAMLRKLLPNMFGERRDKRGRLISEKQKIERNSKFVEDRLKSNAHSLHKAASLTRMKQAASAKRTQTLIDMAEIIPDWKQRIKNYVISETKRSENPEYLASLENQNNQNLSPDAIAYINSTFGRSVLFGVSDDVLELVPGLSTKDTVIYKYFPDLFEGIGLSANRITQLSKIPYLASADSVGLLHQIINNSDNTTYVEFAKKLLPYAKKRNVPVYVVNIADEIGGRNKNNIYGTNYGVGNEVVEVHSEIVLNYRLSAIRANPEPTILHEITHSLSIATLYLDPQLNAAIESYLDYIAEKWGVNQSSGIFQRTRQLLATTGGLPYGLANADEFIAEIYGNPAFVEALKLTKPMEQSKFNNLFDEIIKLIVNAINKIFNFTPDNAYEQIIGITDEILELQAGLDLKTDLRLQQLNIDLTRDQAVITTNGNRTNDVIDKAKLIVSNIKEGLNSRIVALKSRAADPHYVKELRALTAMLDSLEDKDALYEFLRHIQLDLDTPYTFLVEAYSGKRNISDNQLMQFKQDYLGFYGVMLENAIDLFNTGYFSDLTRSEIDYLNNLLKDARHKFTQIRSMYQQMVQESFQSTLRRIGVEAGSNTAEAYVAKHTLELESDIGFFEEYAGSLNNANDEALRMVYYMVSNTKNEIERMTFERGKRHAMLANKTDRQALLFELNKNGKKTGYLVRDRNYGEFYADYNKFLEGLRGKYNLERYDDIPTIPEDFVKYMQEKNAWLNQHAERRYTADYYDLFAGLSMETSQARETIQSSINRVLNKAKVNGKIDLATLGQSDWEKLEALYRQKRELASDFNADGTEKVGVDLDIARELQELQQEISKNMNYKPNMDRFNKAKAAAKKKGEAYYRTWEARNTRREYTDEFRNLLKLMYAQDYGPEYDRLANVRSRIFSMYRNPRTAQIDADAMPLELRALIDSIDLEMQALREGAPYVKGGIKFSEIAEIVPTEAYRIARQAALDKDNEESFNNGNGIVTRNVEEFDAKSSYKNFRGNIILHSYWTYMQPKNPAHIQLVPSSVWSEIDTASPFYNKNHNENDSNSVQPKKDQYDNSETYNKIMADPDLKALHEDILDMMTESNNDLIFQQNFDPYKLPQISGSAYQHIRGSDGVINGLLKYIKDQVIVKDDDIYYNQGNVKRPDGSKLYFIPTHYMKMLDDPGTLTNDISGAVIAYFRMAKNFREMNKLAPTIEIIKEQMGVRTYNKKSLLTRRSETIPGKETRVYKALDTFTKMHLYGERKNTIEVDLAGKQISVSKIMTMIRNYTQTVNLGWNITAIEVGFLTGLTNALLESLTGRYYSFKIFTKSTRTVLWNSLLNILNWGNYGYNNKLLAALEFNQISRSNPEIFNRMQLNRIGRFVSNHFWYGGYAGGDFFVKGSILTATYLEHKLISDPTTGEKMFISRSQFLDRYYRDNTKHGEQMWKTYNETLWDAYEVKDGKMIVKPKYSKYVTKQIEDSVSNTVKFLASKADGTLSELDYSYIHANVFWQMVVMHRNFLVVNVQDRLTKKKGFNYQTGTADEALYRSASRIVWNWFKQNIENVKAGNYKLASFQINDSSDRTNLKRITFELLLIGAYWLISQFWDDEADKGDSTWLTQHVAYMAKRTYFEVNAQYDPADIASIIKSPSAAIGTLNSVGMLFDILAPWTYNFNGMPDEPVHRMFRPITRGPYKGYQKWQQAVIKSTPFKHVIEAQDPNLKRKYLQNMVMK